MSEPFSEEAFGAAMERGGFADLTREEREDIRRATAFANGFAVRVRNPAPPYELEPATRLAASESTS